MADNDEKVQDTRREQLEAQFTEIEQASESVEQTQSDKARDEAGRFAKKEEVQAAPEPVAEPAIEPLTTWRKEYIPLQEKLAKGMPLDPNEAKTLAKYNAQREREYSTGISTYKGEAASAKEFKDAMQEFMPLLQQHNIKPAQWIQNLGRAHTQLVQGSPEQKLALFSKLAQDYGVPLAAVSQFQQGRLDPVAAQLMQEVQRLQQNVSGITSWRQQQEDHAVQQEIAKFTDATKYPHFSQVRESMIQLLESGVAQTPDEAYTKAVRLDDTVWNQQQAQLSAQANSQQANQATVRRAKAAAGQVRTATPVSSLSPAAAKDRRSAISNAFEAFDNGRV